MRGYYYGSRRRSATSPVDTEMAAYLDTRVGQNIPPPKLNKLIRWYKKVGFITTNNYETIPNFLKLVRSTYSSGYISMLECLYRIYCALKTWKKVACLFVFANHVRKWANMMIRKRKRGWGRAFAVRRLLASAYFDMGPPVQGVNKIREIRACKH